MISAIGLAGHLGDRLDLRGGEEVRGDAGEAPPGLANERQVVVEGKGGIVSALEEDGGRAVARCRLHLGHHLVHRERVGLLVAGLPVEGAELAVGDADVRVVRIRVDDEGDLLLRDAPEPLLLGQAAQFEKRRLGEEPHAPRRDRAAFPLRSCPGSGPACSVPGGDDVVEGVALHRDLPGVPDDAEDLLPRETGRALRLGHVGDLLLLEGAVDVGGAEVQARAMRSPRRASPSTPRCGGSCRAGAARRRWF